MKKSSGGGYLAFIFCVVISVVWFGKHNAREYEAWEEMRASAESGVQEANIEYEFNRKYYNNCINMDWGSAAQTNVECYTDKIDLDDSHKDKNEAKARLEILPPKPKLYFNGYFL